MIKIKAFYQELVLLPTDRGVGDKNGSDEAGEKSAAAQGAAEHPEKADDVGLTPKYSPMPPQMPETISLVLDL